MNKALVVTSIATPTECMKQLAHGALERDYRFYCIGDRASPAEYELPGCDFISLHDQKALDYEYVAYAPERHYARKNIGYLLAIEAGVEYLLETDDDNRPAAGFWDMDDASDAYQQVQGQGWFNVYQHFGAQAWPRGFPLQKILANNQGFAIDSACTEQTLIWQGLVAGEPDVDAIYRLSRPETIVFEQQPGLFLGRGIWSPFNSQNTLWQQRAFALLYLPAFCSFRATDIIRSYVAQRCLWELDAGITFVSPSAVQERNEHDLMRDFEDEIIIYKHANAIAEALTALALEKGEHALINNLCACYEALIKLDIVGPEEHDLLTAWCKDIQQLLHV